MLVRGHCCKLMQLRIRHVGRLYIIFQYIWMLSVLCFHFYSTANTTMFHVCQFDIYNLLCDELHEPCHVFNKDIDVDTDYPCLQPLFYTSIIWWHTIYPPSSLRWISIKQPTNKKRNHSILEFEHCDNKDMP